MADVQNKKTMGAPMIKAYSADDKQLWITVNVPLSGDFAKAVRAAAAEP